MKPEIGDLPKSPESRCAWRPRPALRCKYSLKEELIEYNLDDCRALKLLTSFLLKIAETVPGSNDPAVTPNVIFSDSLDGDALKSNDEWGKRKFAIPQFEAITKCSYFDYQRSRVFLRTNPALRQIRRRQRRNEGKPSYRITQTVEIHARRCPYCKGTDFCQDGTRSQSKLSLDLRISRVV